MSSQEKRPYTRWTAAQQEQLLQLVRQYQERHVQISWIEIAEQIGGKTARQCYDSFVLHRKKTEPAQLRSESAEERELILKLSKILRK